MTNTKSRHVLLTHTDTHRDGRTGMDGRTDGQTDRKAIALKAESIAQHTCGEVNAAFQLPEQLDNGGAKIS